MVVEKNGKLGALIDSSFLPDLPARQKYLQARVPGAVDLTLNDVLAWKNQTKKKLEDAKVVLVRSTEIDAAGENTENRYARSIMGGVVDDVARCLQKLASIGIENAVITADHGHLFFASEREESMRYRQSGRLGGRPASAMLDRTRRSDAARLCPNPRSEARLRHRSRHRRAGEHLGLQGRRRLGLPPWRRLASGTRHPAPYRPHEALTGPGRGEKRRGRDIRFGSRHEPDLHRRTRSRRAACSRNPARSVLRPSPAGIRSRWPR